mmetsp:Transcript_43362/g.119983  ORF Transcript_43362/g.119983 Transcript_43362/m.119983 type:complete len:432 (+) Transcript_43362:59-1354(+)
MVRSRGSRSSKAAKAQAKAQAQAQAQSGAAVPRDSNAQELSLVEQLIEGKTMPGATGGDAATQSGPGATPSLSLSVLQGLPSPSRRRSKPPSDTASSSGVGSGEGSGGSVPTTVPAADSDATPSTAASTPTAAAAAAAAAALAASGLLGGSGGSGDSSEAGNSGSSGSAAACSDEDQVQLVKPESLASSWSACGGSVPPPPSAPPTLPIPQRGIEPPAHAPQPIQLEPFQSAPLAGPEPWALGSVTYSEAHDGQQSSYRELLRSKGLAVMQRNSLWRPYVATAASPLASHASCPTGGYDASVPAAQALGLVWNSQEPRGTCTPTPTGSPIADLGGSLELSPFVAAGQLTPHPSPLAGLPPLPEISLAPVPAMPGAFGWGEAHGEPAPPLPPPPQQREVHLLSIAMPDNFAGLSSLQIAEELRLAAPGHYDD